MNESGQGALLTMAGTPSVSEDTMLLTVTRAPANTLGIFVQSTGTRAALPLSNGLFCLAGPGLLRHSAPPSVLPTVTDASGAGSNQQPMTVGDWRGDTIPGATIYYQFWSRDPGNSCGFGANFSSGLSVLWLP